eukprot:249546-Prymnesium_polylepis.2
MHVALFLRFVVVRAAISGRAALMEELPSEPRASCCATSSWAAKVVLRSSSRRGTHGSSAGVPPAVPCRRQEVFEHLR